MNNYYEILEVSKNASKEIIEKAYKVLAKKYHPDVQKEENRAEAEQKMKLLNEAYEILSDDTRKKQYDLQLEEELKLEMQEELNRINSNRVEKQPNNNYKYEETKKSNNYSDYYENEQPLTNKEIKKIKKEEKRAQKEYLENNEKIYRNYLRSLGYKVKETYENNQVIKVIINIISKIVIALMQGIVSFFKEIFIKK